LLDETNTPRATVAKAVSLLKSKKKGLGLWVNPQTTSCTAHELIEGLYEGSVLPNHQATEVLQYGKIRSFLLETMSSESSTEIEELSHMLNLALEQTMNLQCAFSELAERYSVSIPVLTENIRNLPEYRREHDWDQFWDLRQSGFLKSRHCSRQQAVEFILSRSSKTRSQALTSYSKELLKHGNIPKALRDAVLLDEPGSAPQVIEEQDPLPSTTAIHLRMPKTEDGATEATFTPELEASHSLQTILIVLGKSMEEVQPIFEANVSRFRALSDAIQATLAHFRHEAPTVSDPPNPKRFSATCPPTKELEVTKYEEGSSEQSGLQEESSLRDFYSKALLSESLQGERQGVNFSVQLERPFQWEATSTDPKYPCAGYKPASYIFWKSHVQKRRAQGVSQKYITFISFDIVQTIVATCRIKPQKKIFEMSDDALINLLDIKFHSAQESNLLMKKFIVPERPKSLAAFELHIPYEDFHLYATDWLKELRVNKERHKDLDKYNLSDVFIQSLQDCKMLYNFARVLTNLSVDDLIASCSDFLQEQVLNESKTAAFRKQMGLTPPDPTTGKSKTDPQKQEPPETTGLTQGKGAMSFRQARAFLTEAQKVFGGNEKRATPIQTPLPVIPNFVVSFLKTAELDINCEGCGRWYRNLIGKTFPFPCHGKCQYQGHPAMNKKYQDGVKWKYPGYACSWKGMDDKDIPPAALLRLQKYSARKRNDSA
jgi:hypothetical protein